MYICAKCNTYIEKPSRNPIGALFPASCPQGHNLLDGVAGISTKQHFALLPFLKGMAIAFLVMGGFNIFGRTLSGGISGVASIFSPYAIFEGRSPTRGAEHLLHLLFLLAGVVFALWTGVRCLLRSRTPLAGSGPIRELGKNRMLAGWGYIVAVPSFVAAVIFNATPK